MKFLEDDILVSKLVFNEVIGVDETGVGDYFTPLVACAAYVPNKYIKFLMDLGVKDSKKISDTRIMQIAPKLMEIIPYSTYILSQPGFNKLSKDYNNNELKFFAHASALSNLHNHKAKDIENANLIIIDKYSTTNAILKYHSKVFDNNWANLYEFSLPTLLIEKAEDVHISVACASIIARYKLLQYMQNQCKEWNFNFSLGASKKVKEQVRDFALTYGESKLNEVCKLNFKIK
ncbi:ribonuclease HIII [Mycoplasmopsis verecunda]|uniref:Ribonuclease n=1 Tax=Mycoplasmopsis verecunda TaxID=171291 RepID=A0A1T4L0V8_9BACT|nr:ribonuclease HIII [Mycoplasmopsis verecunda]WPB54397.1 ribonuclease HIII [Mycoplasmopsis verecunda]SJZ48283.1 ribonuclease HII [Mycoplasmopsis verecunda]